jgi:hypothetical protein
MDVCVIDVVVVAVLDVVCDVWKVVCDVLTCLKVVFDVVGLVWVCLNG